ncbi:MAG: Cu(I)-responsive transcriptional regulator [Alcaligenaceae bacterium]|jgi:Cu(I)-responsive transcriptional regulator|nr:Cu(I)-responsive transcriptional regulator [Alcaligenaceae bacterium]
MNIGEAARQTGISAKMIRYYEDIGLIHPVHRSDSGYRQYTEKDLHALRFIRRSRDLGFSVAQIQELLALWHDQGRASADVKQITQAHIEALQHKIQQLQAMVDTLQHLNRHCSGDQRPNCPILEDLGQITHCSD